MRRIPGPEGHKVEGIQSGWCPRCRACSSGLFESPEAVRSLASMVISFTFPSRPHSSRRSSSSFASRQSSTMRGICTTLSAPGRRVSNGSFHETFRNASLKRTFGSVRTAKVGGRSRQAQDDHQGRIGGELAGSILDRDPLFRKAIAERLGEKVRGEDDLWEVAKSAVWAETQMAARMDGAGHPAPRGPQWWKPHCIGRRETRRAVAAT
jgi:hypothetical protein